MSTEFFTTLSVQAHAACAIYNRFRMLMGVCSRESRFAPAHALFSLLGRCGNPRELRPNARPGDARQRVDLRSRERSRREGLRS